MPPADSAIKSDRERSEAKRRLGPAHVLRYSDRAIAAGSTANFYRDGDIVLSIGIRAGTKGRSATLLVNNRRGGVWGTVERHDVPALSADKTLEVRVSLREVGAVISVPGADVVFSRAGDLRRGVRVRCPADVTYELGRGNAEIVPDAPAPAMAKGVAVEETAKRAPSPGGTAKERTQLGLTEGRPAPPAGTRTPANPDATPFKGGASSNPTDAAPSAPVGESVADAPAPRPRPASARTAPKRVPAVVPREAKSPPTGKSAHNIAPPFGTLEKADRSGISGWARDPRFPGRPVMLDILLDGNLTERILADQPRAGSHHADGFSISPPAGLLDGLAHEIRVVPTNLIADLGGSPARIEAAQRPVIAIPEPVATFAHLVGLDPSALMQTFLGVPVVAAAPSRAGTEPRVTLRDGFAGDGMAFADAWFDGSMLRLRLESLPEGVAEGSKTTLRLYERDDAATWGLSAAGEVDLSPDGITLLEAIPANPLMPLLLVASGKDDTILGTTLLPFPSLLRGGMHHGEVLLLSDAPDALGAVRDISDAILAEQAGHPDAEAPFTVGHLEVVPDGATGAEPIFSPTVIAWLARVAHLTVSLSEPTGEPDSSLSPDLRPMLETMLHPHASDDVAIVRRRTASSDVLRMPPDAVPTLAALFTRRLRPGGASRAASSYVVADRLSLRPIWAVSLPPMGPDLLALQPRDVALPFPQLVGGAEAAPTGDARDTPLAIRFIERLPDHDATTLWPLGSDPARPVLRTALQSTEDERCLVSVLLPAGFAPNATTVLLETVFQQDIASAVEIIWSRRPGDGNEADPTGQLDRHFPGRHRAVEAVSRSPAAEFNRLASVAQGEALLLLTEPTLLHDLRLLSTLLVILRAKQVASVSCATVRDGGVRKGALASVHAGGSFPGHVSFISSPRLVLAEPSGPLPLPVATYPVIANAFRPALVRRAVWQELGGLDAVRFPLVNYDLDFAARAARAGWRHLSTGAVRATVAPRPTERDRLDPFSLSAIPLRDWAELLDSVTVLRDLRG